MHILLIILYLVSLQCFWLVIRNKAHHFSKAIERPYTEEDRPWCQVWRLPVAEDVLVKFSSNIPDWLDSDDDSIFEPYDPDNHGSFKEKGGGLG